MRRHATLCDLAGVNASAGEPDAPAPLDSISAWPWISGREIASSRREIVYDHRLRRPTASDTPSSCLNISGLCARGAIRVDGWKLVIGPEAQNGWYGWFSPNASVPFNKTAYTATQCDANAPCLFNLDMDETEHRDVALAHPEVLAPMRARFVEIAGEHHPPLENPNVDLSGYCEAVERNGNFVGPWMSVPNKQTGGHAGAVVASWRDVGPWEVVDGPEEETVILTARDDGTGMVQ